MCGTKTLNRLHSQGHTDRIGCSSVCCPLEAGTLGAHRWAFDWITGFAVEGTRIMQALLISEFAGGARHCRFEGLKVRELKHRMQNRHPRCLGVPPAAVSCLFLVKPLIQVSGFAVNGLFQGRECRPPQRPHHFTQIMADIPDTSKCRRNVGENTVSV
jgi:hypothetical protein